tara:strand:+ start:68 stop:457 length:390 start_codon:yes stop_codon:yes gene_type:complete
MKNKTLYSVITVLLLCNCSPPSKEELFIGNWKASLVTNLEKKKDYFVTNFMDVNIGMDSLTVKMERKTDIANGTYAWSIKEDSIFLTNNIGDTVHLAKIKELTNTFMTVEMVIFISDSLRVKYEKVNSN